jgi:hypothetical protein
VIYPRRFKRDDHILAGHEQAGDTAYENLRRMRVVDELDWNLFVSHVANVLQAVRRGGNMALG